MRTAALSRGPSGRPRRLRCPRPRPAPTTPSRTGQSLVIPDYRTRRSPGARGHQPTSTRSGRSPSSCTQLDRSRKNVRRWKGMWSVSAPVTPSFVEKAIGRRGRIGAGERRLLRAPRRKVGREPPGLDEGARRRLRPASTPHSSREGIGEADSSISPQDPPAQISGLTRARACAAPGY